MIQYAVQLCAAGVSVLQSVPPNPVDSVVLPSDGLSRARPKILLTSFIVNPGPKLEALMRSAAFLGTESKYDL